MWIRLTSPTREAINTQAHLSLHQAEERNAVQINYENIHSQLPCWGDRKERKSSIRVWWEPFALCTESRWLRDRRKQRRAKRLKKRGFGLWAPDVFRAEGNIVRCAHLLHPALSFTWALRLCGGTYYSLEGFVTCKHKSFQVPECWWNLTWTFSLRGTFHKNILPAVIIMKATSSSLYLAGWHCSGTPLLLLTLNVACLRQRKQQKTPLPLISSKLCILLTKTT